MPKRLSRKDLEYMMDFEGDPYIDGYRRGFNDGIKYSAESRQGKPRSQFALDPKPKRKLSAWQKYIKNKRNHIKYRDGKLNLKKMGVAFRRTRR